MTVKKPISPAMHGLLDYGFILANLTIPSALGLRGTGKNFPAIFAMAQLPQNAFTNHRFSISRKMPFATHGRIDLAALFVLIGVPVATGVMKQPTARRYYLCLFAAAITVFSLTDFKAKPE